MTQPTDHERGPARITDLLARWAAERPEREALRYEGTTRTWAELAERVGRCAGALRGEGLRPGARVAVLDLNHPSCLEITLACARVGTANVVVNFRLAPAEVAYVVNDSGAEVLFVGPEFVGLVDGLREQLPSVRRVVRIGGGHEGDDDGADGANRADGADGADGADRASEYGVAGGADEYERWLAEEPDDEVYPAAPDDCVLQMYTSGTTGFPKGAMLTHRGLLAHAAHVVDEMDAGADDSFLVAMPLFHVGGSSYAVIGLYAGARLVMTRVPDPALLVDVLERERISHAFFVPALMGLLARVPGVAERDYSALRALCYGASPMPLPVLRASMAIFPNVFMQVYGMTETCGVVSLLGPAEHTDAAAANPHRLISAGKPITGVEIEVRDPATGAPVPTGESGEVCLRTDQLMSGYWNKPEASASAIDDDGWYHSGDGGHLDADGYLYITDRIKDMIISGGENIYPAEVERVLAEHPSVADLAVIGVPDDRWGEVPKAIVVAAEGQVVDESELLAYCRSRLAGFKCPRSVDLVAELPRNPTGKIVKKDLRAPYWAGRERGIV